MNKIRMFRAWFGLKFVNMGMRFHEFGMNLDWNEDDHVTYGQLRKYQIEFQEVLNRKGAKVGRK